MIRRIIFICKHNVFRSRIAETLFNRLNKNLQFKAKSAGIIIGQHPNKNQADVIKKRGIEIKGNPAGLSIKLLDQQDIVILVANDVPPSIFPKKYTKKLIVWKIPDVTNGDKREIDRVIRLIEKGVKDLIKKLK